MNAYTDVFRPTCIILASQLSENNSDGICYVRIFSDNHADELQVRGLINLTFFPLSQTFMLFK